MKNIIGIALLLIHLSSFAQNIEITIDNGKSIIDENLNLIICNEDISGYDLTNAVTLTTIINGNNYNFTSIPNQLEYGIKYQVNLNSQQYGLYFSQLSLININTTQEIVNEPKVLADFILSDIISSQVVTSYCGIELRGGVSQSYPKKSYDIELWDDVSGNNNNSIPLLNMRNDDDWILMAMYNEPLRLRNVTNHQLWKSIHTPYYSSQEPNAKSGINTEYIELAINNEYMGIYALGEQVDKKQLKLKGYNGSIRGELYKGISWGASTFTTLPSYDNNNRIWSGFEMKYPKESDLTDWSILYDFVNFVINSSETDFENNISNKFNLNNAVDYFIFLNILRATDNTGKNIYLAKYKTDEPYFYVPWDLDGTYGIIWNGNQENIYNDILSNGFYNRLLNSNNDIFNQLASDRWFDLRSNILEYNNIASNLTTIYNFLLSNGNYEREVLKWGSNSLDLSNLSYTTDWINNRLNFLDIYFGSTILSTNDIEIKKNNVLIFPNPVSSYFIVSCEICKDNTSYTIYNIQGILIMKGDFEKSGIIDIGHLQDGMYLLQIDKRETYKIVKKR